jgi:hypothetical protein
MSNPIMSSPFKLITPEGLCVICHCQYDRGEPHHPECPVGLVEGAKLRAIHYVRKDGGDYADYFETTAFPDLDYAGSGYDMGDSQDPERFGRDFSGCILGSGGYSLERGDVNDPNKELPLEMVFLPPPSMREAVTKAFWESYHHTKATFAKREDRKALQTSLRHCEDKRARLVDQFERDKPMLNDHGLTLRKAEIDAMDDRILSLQRDIDKITREIG